MVEPLEDICAALKQLAARGDVEIVYPVHLNPNVQEPVHRLLGNLPHVTLLPPLDYLPLVHLMKRASLVLTDSGGIQEEAPAFGIPVLVLREVTERPEGVEAGTLKLVGTDTRRIVSRLHTYWTTLTSMPKWPKRPIPLVMVMPLRELWRLWLVTRNNGLIYSDLKWGI